MEDQDHKLLKILSTGCDERIFLREETNANKYHLNPLNYKNLLNRGSCTCGTLTPFGHEVALEFLEAQPEKNFEEILKNQTKRLRLLLNDDQSDFHVYYGPSGSDMMYLPIIFQAMLNPEKPIVNIVTCPEELGSGSKAAAEGLYYSDWNQYGEKIPNKHNISNKLDLKVHFLAAREESGSISDRRQDIRDIIAQYPGSPIIGNLVFGSKSGIKDDLDIIDEFREGVIWVVDMCQFRTDRTLINQLINKNVMLMVTGSKFYQAPPFCGALLVPKIWTEQLIGLDAEIVKDFDTLFSAYDFVPALSNVRKHLPKFKNIGLRMRWEVAIREMEAYLAIPQQETNDFIRRWNQVVIGRLALSDYFKLMPNIELTNDSIISFMVFSNGKALNNEELKRLFDYLVLSEHEGLEGYNRIFLGQPVQYGDSSFIRLAIGSYSVRKQLAKKRFNPKNDLRIIEIIEQAVDKLFS